MRLFNKKKRLWITKVQDRIWVCDAFPKFDENGKFGLAKIEGNYMNVSDIISPQESAMLCPKMPVPFTPQKKFKKYLRKSGFKW